MLARVLAALFALVTPVGASERTPVALLVPAYFYPARAGSDWDRLTRAASAGVPLVAIMNPASGPGDLADANYVRAIAALRAAGGQVLGYVPSGYAGQAVSPASSCKPSEGKRYTPDDVVRCASRYKTLYAVDGIFIDEMGGLPQVSDDDVVAFYTGVYDGLKRVESTWRIFGNPGTVVTERLLRQRNQGGADTLVTFEDLAAQFVSSVPAPYAARHANTRFGAILIEADKNADFAAVLLGAERRNYGFLFVTDDLLPNPYDRLPTSWDLQIAALSAFNAARAR